MSTANDTLPRKLFGTDGVRGLANVAPVTPEVALRLGRALAHVCRAAPTGRAAIVIGRDTRLSGDMLESALAAGICSMGTDVLAVGTLPTPGVAFLTRSLQAVAGAVVSASHNPFDDNGIKLFAGDGFKLPDTVEAAIERLTLTDGIDDRRPTGLEVGRVRHVADARARYGSFLKRLFPPDVRLDRLKVVLDCAHGAAWQVGPQLFTDLGAEVSALGVEPDGANINRGYGALHPERLQDAVRARHADLGIALDGDADRVMLVDELGGVVDGDEVLAMTAADMMARGTLKHATVVATVMSNLGLELALRARGVRLIRTSVGDRYVVEEMRRHGYNLGGDQSGHLLFLDHNTTGDGLAAALQVVQLIVQRQRPLSELRQAMTRLPQALVNVRVARRQELDAVEPVRAVIGHVTAALADRGRVLVRYSGTEPLVRVMVEGEDAAQVRSYAEEIASVIRAELGA